MSKRTEQMTYLTIEPDGDGEYWPIEYAVYEWGTHERHSVLEGQPRKTLLMYFETVADAQKAYPEADVSEYGMRPPENSFDHLPEREMSAREEEEYMGWRGDR